MAAKVSTVWLSIITNVLSFKSKYSYDRSIIPSAEEMGIETKTFHVDYGIEDEALRRRMGGQEKTAKDFSWYEEIEYEESYQNVDSLKCEDVDKKPLRIYFDYTVMEFQEKAKYQATAMDSFSHSECSQHVNQIMGTVKGILSPVANWIGDHFAPRPGPVKGELKFDYSWKESIAQLKYEDNSFSGDHSESYDWSAVDMVEFYTHVAANPHTHGQFDLIIYIINDDHYPCGKEANGAATNVLAYAQKLYTDQYGRPIGGLVNFCNYALQQLMDGHYMDSINILLHEVLHIMLMSDDLVPLFNTDQTDVTVVNEHYHWFLQTQNAIDVAREFWKCDDAKGIPLENQGGAATAFCHLEERFLLGDLLTGIQYTDVQYASKFLFAVAADSGWYCVRIESGSSHFTMGKDLGCEWLNKPCLDPVTQKTNFPQFFCDLSSPRSGCTFDGHSIARCSAEKGYLDSSSGRIGYNEAAFHSDQTISSLAGVNNECPWYNGETNDLETAPQLCMEDLDNLKARCIISSESDQWTAKSDGKGGKCYLIDCPADKWDASQKHFTELHVKLEGSGSIVCSRDDQWKEKTKGTVSGTVSIICPYIDQYCPNDHPFDCKFGSWDEGAQACICNVGFAGTQCDEMDDCIKTNTQKDIDALLTGQSSCDDMAGDGSGVKRETLVGMHHLYAQTHDHHGAGIHLYPPDQKTDVIDVSKGECDHGERSFKVFAKAFITAHPGKAKSIGVFSVFGIMASFMYFSFCRKSSS